MNTTDLTLAEVEQELNKTRRFAGKVDSESDSACRSASRRNWESLPSIDS